MNPIKHLSSLQNPLIKQIIVLKEKSRERKKTGLFVLEGQRELTMALKGNYALETILYQPDLMAQAEVLQLLQALESLPELVEVSQAVYQKIAYRESTEGVIAIARAKTHTLADLAIPKEKALILVAEAPEKPGNIGALLRTADAAHLDAVLIANPKGDLYNPNIVRSSVGCVCTNNIGMGSTSEIIAFLQGKGIQLFCAALSASEPYTQTNFSEASAIVVGTEATGLSPEWLRASTQNIIIPMEGEIDSMNVSVSAAILIFEAKRQRNIG